MANQKVPLTDIPLFKAAIEDTGSMFLQSTQQNFKEEARALKKVVIRYLLVHVGISLAVLTLLAYHTFLQ